MRGLVSILRTWNRYHIVVLEKPAECYLTW